MKAQKKSTPKIIWIRLYLALFFILFSVVLTAGELSNEVSSGGQKRLKVGLALGGGGARGVSHIGVLRALEEQNIPIDCVVGTSMGSIIGGLYASGKTLDEIEKIVRGMDWSFALSDDTSRINKSMQLKERELKVAHSGRLGVGGENLGLSLGLLSGQNLNQVLAAITLDNLQIRDFDDFPIPFRAVATDLATGQEVVIGKGNLATAMRASMSVPGLLAPVDIEGKLLVDGGMANNVPASVARELCGDIVIAVNVGAAPEGKEAMTSVLAITNQLSTFLTWGNTLETIKSLSPDDLLIRPELGDIGSASFSRGAEGIPLGYAATIEALKGWKNTQTLAALGHRDGSSEHSEPAPLITFIQLENNTRVEDKIILSRLETHTGQALDLDLLNHDIDRLYGLGLFDEVSWDYARNEAGSTGIKIVTYQDPAKRNFMQFGLQMTYDSDSNSSFTLSSAYIMSNLNSRGASLRLAGSLGQDAGLSAEFYQPIDDRGRYFFNTVAKYRERELDIFVGDHKAAELNLKTTGLYLGLGRNFGTTGEVRIAYERAPGTTRVQTGLLVNPPRSFDIGEFTLRAVYDDLDSFYFPRTGSRFVYGMRFADDKFGASDTYQQYAFVGVGARTWGKGTLMWRFLAGYTADDAAPLERAFQLGGLGQLSGLSTNQLLGNHVGFTSLTWSKYLLGIKQVSAFAGVSLESGNTWLTEKDIGFDHLRYAASVFVGADSPIGPIYLGYGLADGGENAIYLYVGNPFNFSYGLLSPQ